MALLEKRDGKEWVSIYHYPSLNLLVSHALGDLQDADDLEWNEDNGIITVWETSC